MKRIIITGASRGLGLQIATTLLEEGHQVVDISRSLSSSYSELQAKFGNQALHFNYDLSTPDSLHTFYRTNLRPLGEIHGLVNNAAQAYDDLLTNAKLASIEAMFRVNVFSAMILSKLVVRDMLLHSVSGSLVHVSSVSAHTGYKGLSMYASTKGALEAFSLSVAREWGVKGIRSNCVAAGFMETDMSRSLDDEQKAKIYKRTALQRPTSQTSVAKAVAFLLSDASETITASVMAVDSGTL